MTDSPLAVAGHGRYRWTIVAFILASLVISGLVIWQLAETTPQRWCALAKNGSPEMNTGCFNVLIRLLDIKDHAVIGLLSILGITILSVVVVALGVKVRGEGPGGLSVDIGAQKTEVSADGGGTVTIPTPPSGANQ